MAEVHFKTNVLLKSIIGKDLITDDNIAVLELVKNAFDANSKKVEIIFKNLIHNKDLTFFKKPEEEESPNPNNSKIIIKDTGKGMSATDIENKWLNIAYSEKKIKKEEYGRYLAGNKGVGRFSCDRLGRFLDIYTKQKGSKNIIHLFIDWKKFEVENQSHLNIQDITLQTVEIPFDQFEVKTGHQPFERGTILEISKLRDDWDQQKILKLKRQLEKLINPNQAFKTNSFEIEIEADDFREEDDKKKEENQKINGAVKNRIFENLNFKTSSIEATIDSTGTYITTKLQDKGRELYVLKEHNPFKLLSNIKVTIYYLNPYSKIYFSKQTGIRAKDFGSISLFINGFRIPPYGDDGDDWLALEQRKGQGHSRYLGTRELVGRIEVYDPNEHFQIISSRSGVVNNQYFEQLTKPESPYGFFYKTFRRLERFVAEGIKFDSTPLDERLLEQQIKEAGDSWTEQEEIYVEDSLTKDKRVLSVIIKTIDAKKSEIVSLDIKENFINEIIEEQAERSKKELEKLVGEIANKELTKEDLTELLSKIQEKTTDIYSFSKSIPTTAGKTLDQLISEFSSLEAFYNQKLKDFVIKENEYKRKLELEEEERKRLATELEAERKENLFNKKLSSTDLKEVISLQHHIDRAADKINYNVDFLIQGITQGLPQKTLLKYVEKISLESKKISTVAQFVTNANFNVKANTIKKDLNRFIREYILNVHQEYRHLRINKQLLEVDLFSDEKPFISNFRPLEIIMIIDNLFSNSFKADAKKVTIKLIVINEHCLEFTFQDDGKGITDENLPRIFNLGYTTTDGSGIGLYHIKQLVNSLKGSIEVNNKTSLGVQFKVKIPINES